MSVLKPRNRLVYFRVSEDEFQQFNHLCESTGARSLSDLARSAMQSLIHDAPPNRSERISDRLSLLETMVRELNREVVQLTRALGRHGFQTSEPNGGPEAYGKVQNDA